MGRIDFGDAGALGQAILPGEDDAIASLDAMCDDRDATLDFADVDRLPVRRLFWRDKPDIGPIRAMLDGFGRHCQGIRLGSDDNLDLDEGAGPELVIFVVEAGLQLDGAARLIDLVVDDLELAFRQQTFPAWS